MAQETIYSARDAFFLDVNGVTYKIREPIGWDKVQLEFQRDPDKHGISYEFPSKDVQLEFSLAPEPETGNKSKELIDAEYALNGPDANIFIVFGLYDGTSITLEYTRRRLDLSEDYVSGLYKTRCKTVKDNIDTLIEDFKDVPVNMEQTDSVLNNPIPGITPAAKTNLNLHSKALRQTYEARSQASVETFDPDVDKARESVPEEQILYGQIRLSDEVSDGLVEDLNLPTGFSTFNPIEISRGNCCCFHSGSSEN